MAGSARNDRGIWRRALWLIPLLVVLGSLSGILSNSGYSNVWFVSLVKPDFMPPGWAFGAAWTALYTMLALALATILNEPPSPERRFAITLFIIQIILNFLWSPVFFAGHDIGLASVLLVLIMLLSAITAGKFWRLRPLAGALMIPYLGWLMFASLLNTSIDKMNPGAGESLLVKLAGG